MPGRCCQHKEFDGVSDTYKRILWIVIAINGLMFFIELIAGFNAQSQALKADALDFLADSVTYAISLYVIGLSISVRSSVAIFKGISLLLMGIWVMASTLYRFFFFNNPEPIIMAPIALLALTANIISVLLLLKYRDGDSNVRSVWLCSRNDAIGNIAVLLASIAVWETQTHWPDLFVAFLMALLFISSSIQIVKQALQEKAHVKNIQSID